MKLMQGNCLELLREVPDGSIDMVLCDPPYGVSSNKWDAVIPFGEMWDALHRVCRDGAAIVLNCCQPFTSELVTSNRKEFKYLWYWDKHLKTNFLNAKKQPLRQVEEVAVFYGRQCKFHPPVRRRGKHFRNLPGQTCSTNYHGHSRRYVTESDEYCASTLLTEFPKTTDKGGHPTAKPVGLCEYLIQTYTDEGETVLDFCMGSGSTGVACVNTGRDFVGMELDPHWFEVARERITGA